MIAIKTALRGSLPVTSKVFPEAAFTHSPLTYATFNFNRVGSLSFGTVCDIVEASFECMVGKLEGWNCDREAVREIEAIVLKSEDILNDSAGTPLYL